MFDQKALSGGMHAVLIIMKKAFRWSLAIVSAANDGEACIAVSPRRHSMIEYLYAIVWTFNPFSKKYGVLKCCVIFNTDAVTCQRTGM